MTFVCCWVMTAIRDGPLMEEHDRTWNWEVAQRGRCFTSDRKVKWRYVCFQEVSQKC